MRFAASTALVATLAFASLAPAPADAQRGLTLTDNPASIGLQLGMVTAGSAVGFSMEIPFEYTFAAGPGELAPHFGFMLNAFRGGVVSIGLPMGVRYKFRVAKQPVYVWPLLDLGPIITVSQGGGVAGFVRVGGGVSYLVHPNVELVFQPLGLGAIFGGGPASFSYNLLAGANFRF